jgi:hypothetical protein
MCINWIRDDKLPTLLCGSVKSQHESARALGVQSEIVVSVFCTGHGLADLLDGGAGLNVLPGFRRSGNSI